MDDEFRDAAIELLDAADEITCALDHPEAWTLSWHDAIALKHASERLRKLL